MLWSILDFNLGIGSTLPPQKNVEDVMETWTSQSGYPLLNVERNYEDGSITFSQVVAQFLIQFNYLNDIFRIALFLRMQLENTVKFILSLLILQQVITQILKKLGPLSGC